ncbi:unnamed protein product [Moneuplotes crassus]|uniref:histidine kinase n=1 Tax=Euplotes crassus TaxID=5936 RepID=A0AAD1Y834_EUPCR|nr:unnamed protein product [Moneuplotes crassus]
MLDRGDEGKRKERKERKFILDYGKGVVLDNWVVKEFKSKWVFEDVDFGDPAIEEMYQDHRCKTIKTNWKFVLFIMKILICIISLLFQIQQEHMAWPEKLSPILGGVLLLILEYFIDKYKFIVRYGATFYILLIGLVMTQANLQFTQFRLYEGFLFHISASFLLSTCLVSDWRISSVAILIIYVNLYALLRTYYDTIPATVLYALCLTVAIFGFNAFLISRNFKQEFLATHKAKQASCQLKKILEGLPEGVTIMNEKGDDLKFINKKIKQTFDISSFIDIQRDNGDLVKVKQEIDETLKKIYKRSAADDLIQEDSQMFTGSILNNFMVKIQKQRVEEGKGGDPDVQVGDCEHISLCDFLQQERELCHNEPDNERSTKVSISYERRHLHQDADHLKKDFVIKTSKIDVVNDLDRGATFLQMFIDTTQISHLEEAKAQSNYQRQMLSNVSHEFRTPLNAMSLSLHLMKAYINEAWAKYHQIASSSCDILKGLVEDILDFSKIEAGVFEIQEIKFTFKQLFDEVNSIFEMQTRMKRIDLKFSMQDAFINLEIKSDKNRLKQILLNLVSNSLKFTDRGFINIDLKIHEVRKPSPQAIEENDIDQIFGSELNEEAPVCHLLLVTDKYNFSPNSSILGAQLDKNISVHQGSGMIQPKQADEPMMSSLTKELKIELTVTDTGIGIPKKDMPSLFTLFGKTSSNHNRNKTGTGLGLTICKRLCEKLGGKICLESKEGVGTKVTCSFTCLY